MPHPELSSKHLALFFVPSEGSPSIEGTLSVTVKGTCLKSKDPCAGHGRFLPNQHAAHLLL